jgi:hypothetical protein
MLGILGDAPSRSFAPFRVDLLINFRASEKRKKSKFKKVKTIFVSRFLSIGRKRETRMETKWNQNFQ